MDSHKHRHQDRAVHHFGSNNGNLGNQHATTGSHQATPGSHHTTTGSHHTTTGSHIATSGSHNATSGSRHATTGSHHATLESRRSTTASHHTHKGSRDTSTGKKTGDTESVRGEGSVPSTATVRSAPTPMIDVCSCLLPEQQVKMAERKRKTLAITKTTEEYMQTRRIPELMNFLLTKLLSECPLEPRAYLSKLVDDCMLFRSQFGSAPVLYNDRHLMALVKSHDPCSKGWVSYNQVKRLYNTVGLRCDYPEEGMPTETLLMRLEIDQKKQLYELLGCGYEGELMKEEDFDKELEEELARKIERDFTKEVTFTDNS